MLKTSKKKAPKTYESAAHMIIATSKDLRFAMNYLATSLNQAHDRLRKAELKLAVIEAERKDNENRSIWTTIKGWFR